MKRQRADPSQTRGSKKVKSEVQDDDDSNNIPSTSSSKSAGPGKAKAGKSPKEVSLWTLPQVLSESCNVPLQVCKNFTSLIEGESTLPFIARYRKEVVGNLEIEELRKLKSTMEELQEVQGRMTTMIKTLDSQNKLTKSISEAICNAKDLDELETTFAPFKESKKTLVARARELGLEDPAIKLLSSKEKISIHSLINPEIDGLQDLDSIELGLQHVVASIIGKDPDNVAQMESLVKKFSASLKISKSKSSSKPSPEEAAKFESYISNEYQIKNLKPHMTLILNRGESQKALSIKVLFHVQIETKWVEYCANKYIQSGRREWFETRKKILESSIKDAYSRIVEPTFSRRIRLQLIRVAHQASIENFARNLKSLLLTPPLNNTTVLGMDPGFAHGCKCAVVAPGGVVLQTETIHINFKAAQSTSQPAASTLKKMIESHRCSTIALGNGKASRETERFLGQLIENGYFRPLDVHYTIIKESGASIYSCSPEARKEFPGYDPNVISAISLARRLQDPLTEYVRVSPEHIGVGMYQHDIPKKKLESSLEDVVSECVSFVGVDLNTCPHHVLSKVAGLSEKKAEKVIQYRAKNGRFINRNQFLDVPTIGPKTFEQSIGFLKILPDSDENAADEGNASETRPGKKLKSKVTKQKATAVSADPLDRTCIHPESYDVARKIIKLFKGDITQIGQQAFLQELAKFQAVNPNAEIASKVGESESCVAEILRSLSQPLQYDLRMMFEKPVFRKNVTSMNDLFVGQKLSGQIENVTDFGAFVDIGVGRGALLHTSGMKGKSLKSFAIGARVDVRIVKLDVSQKRIGLELDLH